MLVSAGGDVLGSLSGGCVEGAVVEAALEALHDGGTRLESFGYSDEDAFAAGLTCGGSLEILIQPLVSARRQWRKFQELDGPQALALIRRIDMGGKDVVMITDPAAFHVAASPEIAALLGVNVPDAQTSDAGPAAAAMLAAAAQLEPLLRGGRSGLVRLAPPDGCPTFFPEPVTLLVESRRPLARMLVFGANDFSAALLPAAKLLGYRVTLCDARSAFAGQERFSQADEVVTDWPHRYLAAEAAAGRIDPRTVICVLTHDPKFDVPLLAAALRLDVAFVGAMGSRQSHRRRVESLLAEGVEPGSLSRLHSPIGLDLGAVTPAEVAISITAELVATLNRGNHPPLTSLKDGAGPIHHPDPSPRPQPLHQAEHREAPWT
jgi:xanthine dehydrogenase accessory factor